MLIVTDARTAWWGNRISFLSVGALGIAVGFLFVTFLFAPAPPWRDRTPPFPIGTFKVKWFSQEWIMRFEKEGFYKAWSVSNSNYKVEGRWEFKEPYGELSVVENGTLHWQFFLTDRDKLTGPIFHRPNNEHAPKYERSQFERLKD